MKMSAAAAKGAEVRISIPDDGAIAGAAVDRSNNSLSQFGPVEFGREMQVRAEKRSNGGHVSSVGLDLSYWMERYQQADQNAPGVLIGAVSPGLLRFFRSQGASSAYAEDLVQETWLRIHRVRHTYRPGAPLLPWVYAIARRVRVDHYRRSARITWHELPLRGFPEPVAVRKSAESLPDFDTLVATLPAAQREVLIMLKATGMSIEDVARATSSTVGAVKQKAHRAYRKLRDLLTSESESTRKKQKP
jgi:RNA polymerase sigma-70 factor, ECF subfamily